MAAAGPSKDVPGALAAPKPSSNTIKLSFPKTKSSDEMVIFVVGPNAIKHHIPKKLVYNHSPTMKKLLTEAYGPGEALACSLSDTPEEVFALLSEWMTTSRLSLTASNTRVSLMVQLWVLADKFAMPPLQNRVMDLIEARRAATHAVCTFVIPWVYDYTSPGSPLRRMFYQQCTYYLTRSAFSKTPDHFPKEFLLDFAANTHAVASGKKYPPFNMRLFYVQEVQDIEE